MSLDHARAKLAELLLVLRAHALEQLTGRARLRLVDLRDGEADVDQDPVARLDRLVALEEADVDGAPHAGDIDLGEPVGLVDDLYDATRDGQAHLRVDLRCRFPREARAPALPGQSYLRASCIATELGCVRTGRSEPACAGLAARPSRVRPGPACAPSPR